MSNDIDPAFEADVIRKLHVVRAGSQVNTWPYGPAQIAQAARQQQRARASVGAVGVAACVAASVVGVGAVGTRGGGKGSVAGASTAASAMASASVLPSVAPATSLNPSMDPSAGIEPPSVIAAVKAAQTSRSAAVAAAEDVAPDDSVIPAAELTKLHALALHLASVWGDESPERMEVMYVANSRAVDAALGNLGSPTPASYTIELQGSFSCGSCDAGPAIETGHVLLESYDTRMDELTREMPAQWLDLSRFGRPVVLQPVNTTSAPRPHASALPPVPRPGHPLTLAYLRQAALLGAVDPTTATIAWSEETTIGALAAQSTHFEDYSLPADTKVFVVAVNGRLTNEQHSWARWVYFQSAAVPTHKGETEGMAGFCGEDLCGLSAPAG